MQVHRPLWGRHHLFCFVQADDRGGQGSGEEAVDVHRQRAFHPLPKALRQRALCHVQGPRTLAPFGGARPLRPHTSAKMWVLLIVDNKAHLNFLSAEESKVQRGDSMTLTFGSWVRNSRYPTFLLQPYNLICSGGNSCSAFCDNLQSWPAQFGPNGWFGCGQPKCQALMSSPLVCSQISGSGPGDRLIVQRNKKEEKTVKSIDTN